jgi:hypothetical protein
MKSRPASKMAGAAIAVGVVLDAVRLTDGHVADRVACLRGWTRMGSLGPIGQGRSTPGRYATK